MAISQSKLSNCIISNDLVFDNDCYTCTCAICGMAVSKSNISLEFHITLVTVNFSCRWKNELWGFPWHTYWSIFVCLFFFIWDFLQFEATCNFVHYNKQLKIAWWCNSFDVNQPEWGKHQTFLQLRYLLLTMENLLSSMPAKLKYMQYLNLISRLTVNKQFSLGDHASN